MARETFFSPIMPFAMRPDELNRPARYHSGHLDTDWQKDLIEPFQLDYEYAQKVELGDPFRFQAKTTGGLNVQLFLLDCAGRWLYEIEATDTESVTDDLTADGTQYVTYQYSYADLLTLPAYPGGAVTAGTYYLMFRVAYDVSDVHMWVSEPIEIAARHEGTLLSEYSHSTYKYGVPFSVVPVRFRLRFEAYISQMVPKSASVVYQDQNYDTRTLDFNPYRAWTLFVGQTGSGVPYWLLDKLNRIMGVDSILLNGKQYTASSANPAWAIDGPETTPLKAATIEIQEANDAEDFITSNNILNLWTSVTPPYAIQHVFIGVGSRMYFVSGPAEIADLTAETAFIAALNATLAASEFLGTITKVGSEIGYNLAAGEKYNTKDIPVLTTKFTWTFTPSVGPHILSVTLGTANGVIAWGDASLNEVSTNTTGTAYSHDYGAAGIYTVNYWGTARQFELTTTQPAALSGLTGTLPAVMESFIISQMAFASNTFNFAFLAPAAARLKTLSLFNNGLVAANNMPTYNFPLLKTVSFSQNALPQTIMNLIIFDVKNNAVANTITNGFLNVAAQVPPVSLNAGGASSKATLTSMGWNVIN